jgi:hypothetical protein
LSIKNPVAAGNKIKCLGCQRLFVAGRTALGGSSTIVNGVQPPAPKSPVVSNPVEEEPARPDTQRSRFRDADEDQPSPANNSAAVAVVVSVLGLLLVVGSVLALYCFLNTDGGQNPTAEALAQLPEKKAPTPPVEVKIEPPAEIQPAIQEPVEVSKQTTDPAPVKISGPPPTLTSVVQKQINQAIDRGVLYLRSTQLPNGTWMGIGKHTVGYTSLPALTMLECGVDRQDISIQAAARAVRIGSARLGKTYELSLAILFLDKLGDPKDKKLIQALAMRLVAGQNYSGGWTYDCPVMVTQTSQELLTFLLRERKYKLENLIGKDELANPLRLTEADLNRKLVRGPGSGLSAPLKSDTPLDNPLQDPSKPSPRNPLPGDPPPDRGKGLILGPNGGKGNSPPQKKDAPTLTGKEEQAPTKDKGGTPKVKEPGKAPKPPPAPSSSELRLLPIFNPVGAGPVYKKLSKLGDHSNTQFALLGLWAARRHGIPLERTFALAEVRFRRLQNEDGGWGYVGDQQRMESTKTMTCVGLLGLAIGRGIEYELLHLDKTMQGSAVKKLTTQDPGIQRGLKKIGTAIGRPRGRTKDLPKENLYLLWSIERVAVLYNLKTMGDRDWYLWGAEILLANHEANGCWTGGGYWEAHPIIDTCFALLFLKRANLAPDLSDNLRLFIPVVDPDSRSSSGGS